MYVIKLFYKKKIVETYYCRTEERAQMIFSLIIGEEFEKNESCYENITFEELCEFAWENCGLDDVVCVEEFEFEEDKYKA